MNCLARSYWLKLAEVIERKCATSLKFKIETSLYFYDDVCRILVNFWSFDRPSIMEQNGNTMHIEGYIDERFKSKVPEDLHCPICQNVLKNAKQCTQNEHHFCEQCILRHLKGSSSCPLCQEYLSSKNLKKPSRFVQNSLDNLEISCENADCKAVVPLGELQSHLTNCDYTLVTCTNQRCHVTVKRKDAMYHEQMECEFRVVRCVQCIRLSNEVFWYRFVMFSTLLVFLGYCFECFRMSKV